MNNRVDLIAQMRSQHVVAGRQPIRGVDTLRTPETAGALTRTIQLIADSDQTASDSSNRDDHSNASNRLRALGPLPSGFDYAEGEIAIAAVIIAAELKVPRKYDEDWVAKHAGPSLMAANTKLVFFWQGSSIGLICCVAAAPAYNGVSFNGAIVTRSGWGLSRRGDKARHCQPFRDMADSPSNPRLFAWRLGSWPMKLVGTLAEMSMGWKANYHMSFSLQPPLQPNCPRLRELPQSMTDEDIQPPQVSPPRRNRSGASRNMGSRRSLNRAESRDKKHFCVPKSKKNVAELRPKFHVCRVNARVLWYVT